MTERFEIKDEGWHTIYDNEKKEYVISDGMLNAHNYCKELCNLLNALHEENEQLKHDATVLIYSNQEYRKENEQLREALKNSYINEICENCKYGHYWISGSHGFDLEGEFECTKKHFGNDHWKCDGLTECDDFELDLKGDDEND